jgi:hypothetical protein
MTSSDTITYSAAISACLPDTTTYSAAISPCVPGRAGLCCRVFQFMCECTALRTRLIIALQVKCSTLPRPAWIIREGRSPLAAVSCRSHVKVLRHRGSQDRGAKYCPREVNNLAATCLVGREGRSMLASCVRW